jgi:hypothetical protein
MDHSTAVPFHCCSSHIQITVTEMPLVILFSYSRHILELFHRDWKTIKGHPYPGLSDWPNETGK